MTTILDSELNPSILVSLNYCRSAKRSGFYTRFFYFGGEVGRVVELATVVDKDADRLVSEIWKLLEPVAASGGMEILEVEYRRESAGWVLRVFIDNEKGVAVDDCALFSRMAGDVLDVADVIPTAYNLEISSPGLNRPLRKWEHFKRHIGDIIEIRTIAPLQANRRNYKGILKDATQESVVIESDAMDFTVPLLLIERARLLYFETKKRGPQ